MTNTVHFEAPSVLVALAWIACSTLLMPPLTAAAESERANVLIGHAE